VAESDGLENRCVARHRGFESHSLRQIAVYPLGGPHMDVARHRRKCEAPSRHRSRVRGGVEHVPAFSSLPTDGVERLSRLRRRYRRRYCRRFRFLHLTPKFRRRFRCLHLTSWYRHRSHLRFLRPRPWFRHQSHFRFLHLTPMFRRRSRFLHRRRFRPKPTYRHRYFHHCRHFRPRPTYCRHCHRPHPNPTNHPRGSGCSGPFRVEPERSRWHGLGQPRCHYHLSRRLPPRQGSRRTGQGVGSLPTQPASTRWGKGRPGHDEASWLLLRLRRRRENPVRSEAPRCRLGWPLGPARRRVSPDRRQRLVKDQEECWWQPPRWQPRPWPTRRQRRAPRQDAAIDAPERSSSARQNAEPSGPAPMLR
jgi:hypothetical protein